MKQRLTFSERNGYIPVSDVIIRECMPESVVNAINNTCANRLNCAFKLTYNNACHFLYEISIRVWQFYFNKYIYDYNDDENSVINYIYSDELNWHEKLSLLEEIVAQGYKLPYCDPEEKKAIDDFVNSINSEFERLNYAYRFIDNNIVEITSKEEIESIENALKIENNGIKTHISTALQFLSQTTPDYRNSIKESISAVGVMCREITSKNTLGDALKYLESNGIRLPSQQKQGIVNIYNYANDSKTGIRHELLKEGYEAKYEDAIYMLVMCSAFINYIHAKQISL